MGLVDKSQAHKKEVNESLTSFFMQTGLAGAVRDAAFS